MIIPVRCYSCGAVVGHLYERYKALLENDYTTSEALDALHLRRYCCRRMILSHIELIDDLIPYSVPTVGNMHHLRHTGPVLPPDQVTPGGGSLTPSLKSGAH